MIRRIAGLLLFSATLLLAACEGADAGGDFDCALWRRRAADAAADVARQEDEIQHVTYKGLADTRRREAMRRLQDARTNAERLDVRADRACAATPDD